MVLIEGINDNEDGRVICLFAALKGLNDTVLKLVLELPPARVQLKSPVVLLTTLRPLKCDDSKKELHRFAVIFTREQEAGAN